MNQISSALLEPPAPAPTGHEPPGTAPDTPFAAVLDDHQARTAVAEGHRRTDEQSDDRAPARDAADDVPTAAAQGALAALLGGVPLPADAVVTASPAGAGAEPQPLGGRVLSPGEAFREQARGIVLTRATRPIGVPDAAALPLRPVSADAAAAGAATAPSPSLPIGPGVAVADGRAAAAGTLPARATRLADVLQAAAAVRADATDGASTATPSPATVAGAGGRASADASGQAPAAPAAASAAAPPVVPTAAPAAAAPASAPAAPTLPARAVGLEHAVETVRLALRAGAERGVTHARISLTPRELGTIEVHLRHTADGLVARVVAEHATAAQQLQQAGGELRRQLEQQGIDLLRLDIGASGEQGGRAADRRASADAFADAAADGRRGGAAADPLAPLEAAETTATATLTLPNGALVDVLA